MLIDRRFDVLPPSTGCRKPQFGMQLIEYVRRTRVHGRPDGLAHFSPSQKPEGAHFSRLLREVGLLMWRLARDPNLHLQSRPIIHHDGPSFSVSIGSEAAPLPLVGSLHHPALDGVAVKLAQLSKLCEGRELKCLRNLVRACRRRVKQNFRPWVASDERCRRNAAH
jgi:hypothetical protein